MASRREFLVPKPEPSLGMAIPASLVSDVPHLREKTAKVGLIGRSAAIFRVEEVLIYEDRPGGEADLISAVLSYMETPQYLRKLLVGLRPELRYAGILPPLRTPHHPLRARSSELRDGELREGVVVEVGRSGCLIEVGVEKPLPAPGLRAKRGARMTFRVERRGKSIRLRPVGRREIPYYWGYDVRVVGGGLRGLLEWAGNRYDLVIGTSRLGREVGAVLEELLRAIGRASRALVLFGSPSEGLYDMAGREGLDLEGACDFVLNTIPGQGVATVRTEEAVLATLAILNLLISISRGRRSGGGWCRAPP